MVDSSYKDQNGNIWVCKMVGFMGEGAGGGVLGRTSSGVTVTKERSAMLVNMHKGTVWFTTEPDWKLFEELKRK